MIIVVYCMIYGYTTTVIEKVTCVRDVYYYFRSLPCTTATCFILCHIVLHIKMHSHTYKHHQYATGVDPWYKWSPWAYYAFAMLICLL